MLVRLKKRWFSPEGNRYPPGDHEFPNSMEKFLPSTAEILSKAKPVQPKAEEE